MLLSVLYVRISGTRPTSKMFLTYIWYTDDANVCVSVAMQQPLHSQRDSVSDRYRRLTPAVGGAPGPVAEETQTGRGHKQGSYGLLPESLEDSPEMSRPLNCRICLAFLHHPWGASTYVFIYIYIYVCMCVCVYTTYVTRATAGQMGAISRIVLLCPLPQILWK